MPPESVPSQEPPSAAAEWQAEEPLASSSEAPPPAEQPLSEAVAPAGVAPASHAPAPSDFIIEVGQPAAAPAEVAPPRASVPLDPPPAEMAVALEPEPVVIAPPKQSRPALDTIVEPTLVPHGRPFMLSATFLNPPPERPPLQTATIVEPIEPVMAAPSQAEPNPSEVPPAPVSADGTLVMPIEEIGELPPDRESRPQLYTLPLAGFEEEVRTGGPVPPANPSASGSLSPMELAIFDDPVDLPVQRVRPAIAAPERSGRARGDLGPGPEDQRRRRAEGGD
ncbi:MAG: hypothetical protein JRI68_12420 [Deltaproteobacteria bacterium]|nr:hypothetical protein [Deltaproteobacteria bacterium]